MRHLLSALVLAGLLALPSMAASAKTTTVNDITLDVPDGYDIASSKRGILVKTPDGEVDVWVETFDGAETQILLKEHADYWQKEKVVFHGDGNTTKGKSGEADVENTNFPNATWKGDPTVLRYSAIGPFGPKKEMVLVTYWASPEGDKEFGDAIQKMVSDINFKIHQ